MKNRVPVHIKITRLLFPSILALGAILSVHAAVASKYFVYVGTYTGHGSQGIYVCDFDSSSGRLGSPRLAAATAQPSFLAITKSRRFLYAVNEFDQFNGQAAGAVSAFSVDSATGKLKLLNQVSSRGAGPAFITLDRSEHFVLIANYDQGSVAVFRLLPNGKIGESTAYVVHKGSSVNPKRQEGPHAHAIAMSPDNRFAIVADLGLDQLLVYPFDASVGTLGQARVIKTDPGAGPRHLVFAGSGRFLYVIDELSSTISVYSYSHEGAIVPIERVSSLPSGFNGTNTAAEIVLHPSGRFLYASNRGDDNSIAVFGVDPEVGSLTLIEHVPSRGKTPRSIAVDPLGDWLLAANQDSNTVVTFRINKDSGRLTLAGPPIQVNSPAMVDFMPRGGG
jgi:6-phosphogluconolactonase